MRYILTILDAVCRDFVFRFLIIYALDLDDEIVTLCEASVLTRLETVTSRSSGICSGEGGTFSTFAIPSWSDELVKEFVLRFRHFVGFCGLGGLGRLCFWGRRLPL